MNPCLEYIYQREGNQQEIMLYLHELIIAYPEVTCKIRYNVPFYYRQSWICYLNPIKGDCVELVFLRANELSNEQRALDFKDRKQVAGITFARAADIQDDILYEILQEALLLDEEVKYASKRQRRK